MVSDNHCICVDTWGGGVRNGGDAPSTPTSHGRFDRRRRRTFALRGEVEYVLSMGSLHDGLMRGCVHRTVNAALLLVERRR